MKIVLPWVQAARPKTLMISMGPPLIGTALAPVFDFWIFFYTLLTAIGIQVTSHFASDYFDHLKGADQSSRKGFVKVLQSGLVQVEAMKRAIVIAAVSTTLLGTYIVWVGGPIIALCLAVSMALAILYNGGPYPLSYLGLSDLFAFAFYGPIPTASAYYLQTQTFSFEALVAGISPGAYAASIMMINNLRDVEEDRSVYKRTFPVRFGVRSGKILYIVTMMIAPIASLYAHKFLPLLLIVPAFVLMRAVLANKDPYAYDPFFKKTALLHAAHTLLFCL